MRLEDYMFGERGSEDSLRASMMGGWIKVMLFIKYC